MRKDILGIPIDWLTVEELERKLKLFVVSQKPHHITTVNAEFVVLSHENQDFRVILQASDLSLPDGTSLVLAQTLENMAIASPLLRGVTFLWLGLRHLLAPGSFSLRRITGVELTERLLQLGNAEHWKFFLLGAAPGVAEQAGERWKNQYPGVTIVGTSSANPDDLHIIDTLKSAKPDILLVAYGAPKQELFIAKYKDALKIPIMVGVGGTFDYAIGIIYRPPTWVRAIGLEWLVRLLQQPKRIKRIWRSTVTFTFRIITSSSVKVIK